MNQQCLLQNAGLKLKSYLETIRLLLLLRGDFIFFVEERRPENCHYNKLQEDIMPG